MRLLLCGTLFLCVCCSISSIAQDSTGRGVSLSDRALDFPGKMFNRIKGSSDKMQKELVERSEKYIRRMARQEDRIKGKLYKIDSAKAIALFSNSDANYQALLQKLQSNTTNAGAGSAGTYIGSLDTLHTSLAFLQQNPSLLSSVKDVGALGQSVASVQQLQARLGQTADIQQFVAQREQLLKTQLGQYGFGKELNGLNQQAYYYQQRLQQYKQLLHDKDKLKQKALDELSRLPAYQTFMEKNSYLGRLFGLPEGYGSASAVATGLQTKAMVQQVIGQLGSAGTGSSVDGSSGGGSSQYVQQQLAGAQQAISQLQSKVTQVGLPGASQGALTMPDFQPNTQRTKTFFQRIELGFQLQAQKSNILLPTTANIGLKLGYKLSDKADVGIGASYLMGMGNGINQIRLSNQGVGLQSYLDIKMKGSIWISGGIEANYLQAFSKFDQLRTLNAWQQSALIGLTKKYRISAKYQGNLQLLYDALYRQHVPASQPILFRTGIGF